MPKFVQEVLEFKLVSILSVISTCQTQLISPRDKSGKVPTINMMTYLAPMLALIHPWFWGVNKTKDVNCSISIYSHIFTLSKTSHLTLKSKSMTSANCSKSLMKATSLPSTLNSFKNSTLWNQLPKKKLNTWSANTSRTDFMRRQLKSFQFTHPIQAY